MKALVLSGGGALGAFEAGAITALRDAGQEFDLICGTSIGAINAAFAAQDKVDDLAAVWHRIGTLTPPVIAYVDQVQHTIDFVDKIQQLGHGNPFALGSAVVKWMQVGSKTALLGLRGCVKPDAIETILSANLDINGLHRSLIVTGTNLTYGSSEAFYAFRGANSEAVQAAFLAAFGTGAHLMSTNAAFSLAVRASAAIPGAFAPVEMNLGTAGVKDFVDGGVANNIPVTLAADVGMNDITVILLQPKQITAPTYATSNLIEIGMAALTVMQQKILQQDMANVNARPGVVVRYIQPATPLPLTVLGFDNQSGINQAFEAGANAARDTTSLSKDS